MSYRISLKSDLLYRTCSIDDLYTVLLYTKIVGKNVSFAPALLNLYYAREMCPAAGCTSRAQVLIFTRFECQLALNVNLCLQTTEIYRYTKSHMFSIDSLYLKTYT